MLTTTIQVNEELVLAHVAVLSKTSAEGLQNM
jgi:hypothetical protein